MFARRILLTNRRHLLQSSSCRVIPVVVDSNATGDKAGGWMQTALLHQGQQHQSGGGSGTSAGVSSLSATAVILGGSLLTYLITEKIKKGSPHVFAKEASLDEIRKAHDTVRKDLPEYTMDEIVQHNAPAAGIWVTYGVGVYDITSFVPKHPGSDKVMLAAGGAIDPFWHIFQQHNTHEVLSLLETYRIGNLRPDDVVGTKDLHDPWSGEPKRHPILKPATLKPFNAEPPASVLVDSFLTPNEFFYVRNHLPVPEVDIKSYELDMENEKTGRSKTIRFADLLKYPKHTVTATIMCGGNRRSEMMEVKPIKGLPWGASAVGNARWTGARLCDVLRDMGVRPGDEEGHVQFEGLDTDPTSTPYGASIPLAKAMDPRGDVILAYEMNGQPLNRDHGFPVRVIVPGVVGSRNVKWLGKIIVSRNESASHWQQNDYKSFSPSTDWDTVDFKSAPAIQNMPITSAICTPASGETVKAEDGYVTVKGYAWSGGGSEIVRVDLSADGGKTWIVAKLDESERGTGPGRHWSWSLWSAKVPVKAGQKGPIEILSKAVDSNYNTQPESFANIWNLRGVVGNAYSRVKVNVK
ncbi:sulfite oxidase isoform X1 [Anopheles stephensi]|uniref:sulfite oxidase isoform X1 n=1 Tax=Anopheles stephensi TaxID=30069 RepID=UPI0016587243|nr:sulfite oxidase isoform X1 [Anopheles stephensi]XP_035901194.1 sulfite oxidase isoform X1 [Anopheles stephensi]XP_035901195.1 sulfite oxidase isoform X1 [Anopheles stephensi]XP_035901196.1 sulfite oxidase isoform X1 [Anopheles stephensi]XP_035901197.1 sulfite oxidase isoform X1 [Anopheles stephensi]XP_035901198.1 sulfite oxidase isoform X1 [Anopheles stephensi]